VLAADDPAVGAADDPAAGATDDPAAGATDDPAAGLADDPAAGAEDDPAAGAALVEPVPEVAASVDEVAGPAIQSSVYNILSSD
jgi:hypothetical protein